MEVTRVQQALAGMFGMFSGSLPSSQDELKIRHGDQEECEGSGGKELNLSKN